MLSEKVNADESEYYNPSQLLAKVDQNGVTSVFQNLRTGLNCVFGSSSIGPPVHPRRAVGWPRGGVLGVPGPVPPHRATHPTDTEPLLDPPGYVSFKFFHFTSEFPSALPPPRKF